MMDHTSRKQLTRRTRTTSLASTKKTRSSTFFILTSSKDDHSRKPSSSSVKEKNDTKSQHFNSILGKEKQIIQSVSICTPTLKKKDFDLGVLQPPKPTKRKDSLLQTQSGKKS
ncbi:hypothetical protein [Crucivirus-506]|nr:hypothetical protein [Crucivirus-505]QMW68990.1 hypothetical protein [Crucivirus-506]